MRVVASAAVIKQLIALIDELHAVNNDVNKVCECFLRARASEMFIPTLVL